MSYMHADAAQALKGFIPRQRGSHPWDDTVLSPDGSSVDPYGDVMPAAADVHRIRFAQFVSRALADARGRGMTDQDIFRATGVGTSTFHRWKKADLITLPELENVQRFCEGLGVPLQEALDAMGMSSSRPSPSPEPILDPEIRVIQRALGDPAVSVERKAAVREMLRLIAASLRTGRG